MIEGKSVLAIIPARGGSKGVPKKNIRDIAGKPLLAWTIGEAKKSQYIDRIILSSEDKEIIKIAKEWGCEVPFVRPSELAKDDTPSIEPIIHALNKLPEYDLIVILQPTSPLRKVEDIDNSLRLCVSTNFQACVSVVEVDISPYWMYQLDERLQMKPILQNKVINRRQDAPKVYALNGAVYISTRDELLRNKSFLSESTIAYEMPKVRSQDIDTELDFRICEYIINERLDSD